MVAPSISFRAVDESALAAVYDYGTIDTGSSGSVITWQIWNNYSGAGVSSATNVASAILSGSANALGLGMHDSGSANHIDQQGTAFGVPYNSMWCSGSAYILGSGSVTRVTGSLSSGWTNVYSGSSGVRMLLNVPDGKLSGSADLGCASGSAWVIYHYCYVPSTITQGSKSGSWCLKLYIGDSEYLKTNIHNFLCIWNGTVSNIGATNIIVDNKGNTMSKRSLVLKKRWQNNREEMLKYQKMATAGSPMTKKDHHKTEEHKRKIALSHMGKHLTEEHRKNIGKSWKYERHITPQFRKKHSEYYKKLWENGIPPPCSGWNKGLTKETDERVRKNAENISKAMKGKTIEDMHGKEKAMDMRYKFYLGGLRCSSDPNFGKKIRNGMLTKTTPEQRRQWSQKAGLCAVKYGKKQDTKIELMLQEKLKENNIEFDTQVIVPKTCVIDIVPKNTKIAIFADGDYWHNLPNMIEKDKKVNQLLLEQGWKIFRFWEHEIHNDLNNCILKVLESM